MPVSQFYLPYRGCGAGKSAGGSRGFARGCMGFFAAVNFQLANGADQRPGKFRIELDLVHAAGISAVTLQNAQVSNDFDYPEIHLQVNSHAFLRC